LGTHELVDDSKVVLLWCVNTVEEKFRKNRLLAFGEPKLRRMSVKLAEEFNRRRGESKQRVSRVF